VYTIDHRIKLKGGCIVFHGHFGPCAEELVEQVAVKKAHIWAHGSVRQELLKQSSENIQALYRDRGYEEVKVNPRTVDRQSKIDVAFDIEEGAQTLVEDVQVSGNQNVASDQLTSPKGFQLRAGGP